MHTTHTILIHEMRDSLGIHELDVDDSSNILLKFDDQLVEIEFESEPTAVVKLPLGKLPEASTEANVVLRTVMAGQLMWEATAGATIGLDPVSDSLFMTKRLLTIDYNGARFLDEIASLTELAARWASFVADPNEQDQPGSRSDSSVAELDPRALV